MFVPVDFGALRRWVSIWVMIAISFFEPTKPIVRRATEFGRFHTPVKAIWSYC
jgi:hypothetical protein